MATSSDAPGDQRTTRRKFMSNVFMGVGLTVSHLTVAGFALKYLYPPRRVRRQRLLVGLARDLPVGGARAFKTPRGESINIVHGPRGFVALSDVCPHLGCRVHWDGTRREFVCPCHNGHFDPQGRPISGPPADMGAALSRFSVVEQDGLVFIELENETGVSA